MLLQFEKSRQNEGCRISALHRETSDLCETDVRQMNAMSHVEESSDEDDDDEFDEERPRPNPVEKTGRVSIIRSNKAKGRKSIRAKAGGNVPVTPSPAISERKVSTRGGTSLFDSADKGFEHSVANSALFSEFMAGAGSSSASASTGGKFSRVQKTPLLRLSSNDRYVLDYGAKFRELMGDADTTTEAKCHRIYAYVNVDTVLFDYVLFSSRKFCLVSLLFNVLGVVQLPVQRNGRHIRSCVDPLLSNGGYYFCISDRNDIKNTTCMS